MQIIEKLRAVPAVEALVEKLTPTPPFDAAALVELLVSQPSLPETPDVLAIEDAVFLAGIAAVLLTTLT